MRSQPLQILISRISSEHGWALEAPATKQVRTLRTCLAASLMSSGAFPGRYLSHRAQGVRTSAHEPEARHSDMRGMPQ